LIVTVKLVDGVEVAVVPTLVPVPDTVTVYVPALLFDVDVDPPLPQPESAASPTSITANAANERRTLRRRNDGTNSSIARKAPPLKPQRRSSFACTDVAFAWAVVDPMVIVEVPVPPAVSETFVGATAQVGWKVAELVVIEQVSATEPTKLLIEVSVSLAELPVVAPETKLREAGVLNVKVGGGTVTVTTIVDALTTVVPLLPVTITLRTPLVPAVVLMVSTLLPVPPEVRVSEVGAKEQVPVAVPLAFVTEQVRATVPAKESCEANVMVSVLPVVAPAASVMAVVVGVIVNVTTGCAAAVRKLDTSSEPRPVAKSYPAVTA